MFLYLKSLHGNNTLLGRVSLLFINVSTNINLFLFRFYFQLASTPHYDPCPTLIGLEVPNRLYNEGDLEVPRAFPAKNKQFIANVSLASPLQPITSEGSNYVRIFYFFQSIKQSQSRDITTHQLCCGVVLGNGQWHKRLDNNPSLQVTGFHKALSVPPNCYLYVLLVSLSNVVV